MFHSTIDKSTFIRQDSTSPVQNRFNCDICVSKNQTEKDGYDTETELEIHRQIKHKPRLIINRQNNFTTCLVCTK